MDIQREGKNSHPLKAKIVARPGKMRILCPKQRIFFRIGHKEHLLEAYAIK